MCYTSNMAIARSGEFVRASVLSSYNNIPIGDFAKDSSFGDVMYANIQDDKQGRLRDYRIIAAYSEVADALDEICDESISKFLASLAQKTRIKASKSSIELHGLCDGCAVAPHSR